MTEAFAGVKVLTMMMEDGKEVQKAVCNVCNVHLAYEGATLNIQLFIHLPFDF